MDIVGMIKELAGLSNRIIDKLDTPEKRAQARREYEDSLLALKDKILEETDAEKRSELLNLLITALHGK